MGNSKKLMLIGWDAADWKIIHSMIEQGHLPTIANAIENGVMGNLRTLSPVLSPMLWTSIATGKRPYKHGIYGFTEPAPGGKSVQPMTNVSRKCKAIWNILNQQEMESIVVGWWPSHPAEPINGAMVSDFFHKVPKKPGDPWKLLPNCVHPANRQEELKPLRLHPTQLFPEHVRPFVPLGHEIDQDADSRLSMVMRMLCECTTIHDTAERLLDTQDWDFSAIYYDAIDHFCHGFMKYHPPRQPHIDEEDFKYYQNVVTAAYRYHDMLLKKLIAKADENTTFILMSDHGFHPDHLRPQLIPSEPAGPAIEHRDYGIFLAWGPNIKKDQIVHSASLLDITPTILSVYGLPVGDDMDGRVLVDIFEEEPEIESIPSWEDVDGNDGQHPKDMVIAPSDSKEALEQLVALGYIEAPDQDVSKAIMECNRELDYNLARSHIDAGMHGEAMPLLFNLYNDFPLEFRFGFQLATCLRAMNQNKALGQLIDDINSRWRVAAEEARELLKKLEDIRQERLVHWNKLKEIDDEHAEDENPVKLARVDVRGHPVLFDESEKLLHGKIRSIARGNSQSLDFLQASVKAAEGDFEGALALLEKAKITKTPNPGFQFHVGTVYLGLKRLDDAEEAFSRALELDEFHPNALMGLCRTYVEKGNWQKAIDFGQQATGLKFHFPVAHYFLGRAKFHHGDPDSAIRSLQTAVNQNPNFVEVHELLAKIYRQTANDENLANQHLAMAKELQAENAKVQQQESQFELPEFKIEDFRAQLPKLDFAEDDDAEFVRPISQAASLATMTGKTEKPEVIIVSGLPRSGTSMMMQMLVAGGVTPFTDSERIADESNPKGYFEAEIVKKLPKKNRWVRDCDGQVIKVVAPLVPYLPQGVDYKVIFMNRNIGEILRSQSSMLDRLDKKGGDIDDDRLAAIFSNQANIALHLLKVQNQSVLGADYHRIVSNPRPFAEQLNKFLGRELDVDSMVGAVLPELYREKD